MEVGMAKGCWGVRGHRPGETGCGQTRWKGTRAGPREGLMRRPRPPRSGRGGGGSLEASGLCGVAAGAGGDEVGL